VNNDHVTDKKDCSLNKGVVKTFIILTLAIFICYMLFVIFSFEKIGVLEIRDTDTGKLLRKWQLNEHDEFAIEFIHSVNKSPVRETFKIENGKFRLMNVRFYSYGAGIQSDLGEGQTLKYEGDVMIISGYNTSFDKLNIITGAESNHILFINNRIILLQELSKNSGKRNTHITMQYR